jgi:hypothetical protein
MSPRKLLSTFFAVAALAPRLLALNPDTRLSQYGHSVWHVQDGPLNGHPTAFAQTSDGYIWTGTQSGLYRFDGVRFLAWNPPAGQRYPSGIASIASLYAARDGSLWIGTDGGLAHWANGMFTSIPAPAASSRKIGKAQSGSRVRTCASGPDRSAGYPLTLSNAMENPKGFRPPPLVQSQWMRKGASGLAATAPWLSGRESSSASISCPARADPIQPA